jgi:hypothetical protein
MTGSYRPKPHLRPTPDEKIHIPMSPNEYATLPRDSRRENEVCKWLREQNEHDKFEFVWRVLRKNGGLGLALVKAVQLRPIYLEVILEHGFVYCDASSVRFWLDATIGGLGERRVFDLLADHLDRAPLIVDKVLYWFRPKDERVQANVNGLRMRFVEMYPGFQSTRSTGIHATGA